MPRCDDRDVSRAHPSLFDLHLEPLHPRLHLLVHHHRVDPSIQGHFLGLERGYDENLTR